MQFSKLVQSFPDDANAIDIFSGHWVVEPNRSDVASSFRSLYEGDDRVPLACNAFGSDGRLDGFKVLELGPLEAGHTFMLERAGAEVTAIEGNAEAYMKCLIVKEVLGLKSRFLLGSFLPWLAQETQYDLIFASGVLYHMPDPVALIRMIADRTDRAFFWTHYYEPIGSKDRVPEPYASDGLAVTYYRRPNAGAEENSRWWGGLYDSASWLDRHDLLKAFDHCGFKKLSVLREETGSEAIPAHLAVVCSK